MSPLWYVHVLQSAAAYEETAGTVQKKLNVVFIICGIFCLYFLHLHVKWSQAVRGHRAASQCEEAWLDSWRAAVYYMCQFILDISPQSRYWPCVPSRYTVKQAGWSWGEQPS